MRPIAKFTTNISEEAIIEGIENALWNRHPWNVKAKELLMQLEEEGVYAYPEALYVLQLAEWGLANLPEYNQPVQIPSFPMTPRDTLHNDLYDLISDLMHHRSPTFAMEFMTETPWDESDAARPYVEAFQKLTEPGEAAALILENLTERMRWWTKVY